MTDRSVVVRLRAQVTDFRAGMASAGQSVDALQGKLATTDAKTKASTQQTSRGMLLIGGAAIAGVGVAISQFAKFDKEMSNVKAVSNATAGEMGNLRDAAIEAGAATVFSAQDAARAEAELAKAGVGTADILGGALTGSLNLASAGQLDLADAATISAQAMNIFKLRGRDVGHIADVLAAGANKSAADVGQLGDALRQGGLVAAQTGLDLETTVGTLSAFADNALVGSDAGTSFKTMLQRLTPQSKESSDAMDAIGFSAYDAQGNFIGLDQVAQQLQRGLGGLSAEQRNATLTTIFGSDAVRAANVLYEEGAAGIRSYTDAVNDQGAATRMAATQLDNLAGDIEQFKGSVQTDLIQAGSGTNTFLRGTVQFGTKLANTYGSLPGVVQGTATAVVASAGLIVGGLGAIGTVAPKIRQARQSLRELGAAGEAVDRTMGKVGRTVGKLGVAFVAFEAIDAIFDGVNSDFQRFEQVVEASAGAGTRAKIAALRGELERYQDIANSGPGGFNIDLGVTNLRPLDLTGGKSAAADKADAIKERIKELQQQLKLEGIDAKNAGDATGQFGDTLSDQVSPAVQEATDAVDNYKTALDNLNGVNISAARAQLQLKDSYEEATKAVNKSADVSRDEKGALLDLADQANQTAGAIIDQTGSQEKANASMKRARQHFIDTAVAMGYTREEARKLADKFLAIPSKVNTDFTTPGLDHAISQAATLRRQLLNIPRNVSVAVNIGVANKAAHLPIDGRRAAGGPTRANGVYLVGEHGPELFSAPMAGRITPAHQTAAMLAGSRPLAAAAGDSALMRDLIVYTQQERVEQVIPRVLDQQMYLMRG